MGQQVEGRSRGDLEPRGKERSGGEELESGSRVEGI